MVSLRSWLSVAVAILLALYLGVIGVGAVFYRVLASHHVTSK